MGQNPRREIDCYLIIFSRADTGLLKGNSNPTLPDGLQLNYLKVMVSNIRQIFSHCKTGPSSIYVICSLRVGMEFY